jgi:glutaredoxin-like protein
MALIQDREKAKVREILDRMDQPVRIVNFTQELECQYCRETRQLFEEVADLSDKLSLEVYNFLTDKGKADEHKVDKIPATVLLGEKDHGIRFYGIPAGYEFATLLEDIVMVSQGDSGLSTASREKLRGLKDPLHLQVYVTPA